MSEVPLYRTMFDQCGLRDKYGERGWLTAGIQGMRFRGLRLGKKEGDAWVWLEGCRVGGGECSRCPTSPLVSGAVASGTRCQAKREHDTRFYLRIL